MKRLLLAVTAKDVVRRPGYTRDPASDDAPSPDIARRHAHSARTGRRPGTPGRPSGRRSHALRTARTRLQHGAAFPVDRSQVAEDGVPEVTEVKAPFRLREVDLRVIHRGCARYYRDLPYQGDVWWSGQRSELFARVTSVASWVQATVR